jgi:hypothetical protein
VPYFRDNHYWAAWKYLEIEKQRIHQNLNRLVKTDKMNRSTQRPTGAQLLQQSMYGTWNIIDEQLTSTIPAFIRTGDTYFHRAESNINTMLKAFNLPQLFITLTFSEKWPQLIDILGGKNNLCTNYPWEAVQYYYERMH